jgi:hypothetical protein
LNPGVTQTFPWLSQIARNFQTYSFKGIVFHYVPTSGNAVSSTNNALGSVMFQTSYRANDALPASKVEMLNEYWSCEVVPSDTVAHPIECAPKENPFQVQYVRTGNVPVGDNLLLYDLGATHVAVSGMQANDIVVGDIWVSYEVELSKPIISSNVTSSGYYSEYYNATSPTASDLFGVTTTIIGNLPLDLNANTITIPIGTAGTFRFFVGVRGTLVDVSLTGAPTTVGATAVRLMNIPGPSRFELDSVSCAAGTTAVYAFEINKSEIGSSATVTIPIFSQAAGTSLATTMLLCYGYPFEA